MTKDSSATECSAFCGDQGSALFEKKAIKCVCFHPDKKELLRQTSAALENNKKKGTKKTLQQKKLTVRSVEYSAVYVC